MHLLSVLVARYFVFFQEIQIIIQGGVTHLLGQVVQVWLLLRMIILNIESRGESSRGSSHPSSNKSILQKSSPISSKLCSSNSLSWRKTCRMHQIPITLGQWNSTQNSFAGLTEANTYPLHTINITRTPGIFDKQLIGKIYIDNWIDKRLWVTMMSWP